MERIDVLHVDDDDAWSRRVKRWLGGRNLKVVRLSSRREVTAFFLHNEVEPRCILLELALRDASGLKLCDEIKNSPTLQHLPVVILTGASVSSRECLEHRALYRLRKDGRAEQELGAVVESIIFQQERSQGIVNAGDLRLDPHEGHVMHDGKLVASLRPGLFRGFLELLRSSPQPIADAKLYLSFLARHAYRKPDPEITAHLIVRNYISNLRRDLGSVVGGRIVRVKNDGYAYRPLEPLSHF